LLEPAVLLQGNQHRDHPRATIQPPQRLTQNVVKMTFAKGAFLKDRAGPFNSSLEGNTRRAIDFHEGDKINEKALKALIKAAAKLNAADRD
jgi:hypothetical protein